MSLRVCLPGLVEDGQLTPEQAQDVGRLFDDLRADFVRSSGEEGADAFASAGALGALERQITRKEFLAGRTIKVQQRIAQDLGKYGGGRGGGGSGGGGGTGGPIDPRGGPALIAHDPRAPYSNVEGRRKAVIGQVHRMMDRLLAEHNSNILGQVRGKAQLRDMVRELFGENSGSAAARELAGSWRKASEHLRQRFNAAGGEISYRADWGLPQSHDWRKVRAAGFDAWREAILPRLDRTRMIDDRTGRPFTDSALEAVLPEIFDRIRSSGWNDRTPGSPGALSLANRRADPRFFVFKSADDWLAYAETYGKPNAYDAMMGHVEGMARDIAAMEVLGPNPEATLRWVKGTLEKQAAEDLRPDAKGVSKAKAIGGQIDDLWDEYRGANNEPRNETMALVFSGIRSWQTATKLGSAFLSATSDFAFQVSRRKFNGLPTAGLLRDWIKLMRPGSIEDQKFAVRRGLIAEEWAGRTAAQSRYLMEELTGEIPRRMAEGVLRLSLLSRHTQAMRWAYGMEALATYTEQAGKNFGALDPALRGTLQRYGIDAAGWDALRTAPMEMDRGVEWIAPHNAQDPELAARFMEMIHEETDLAVPVADLQTRAAMNSRAKRGTLIGEGLRSALLFKSFGIAVMLRQTREIMAMQAPTAARYAAGLIIGTTVMGAAAMQLKALAQGQDPRPVDNPEFWAAAMAQGGGWGIFGDFLHSAESRTGGGLPSAVSGPLAQDVQRVADIAGSSNKPRALLRAAKSQIPGNNLWYSRLAFDRLLADQIQQATDPDYRQSFKRMERYAAEQGTAYWWDPGDTAPDRAPDLENALGESR